MAFPIQWGKPAPRTHRMHFVKCPPDRAVYMLARPDEYHTIQLHWLHETNESGICPGDECPLKGRTRHFESCYAPVLQFAEKEGRWVHAILGIGDPGHTLANTDFFEEKIIVGRSRVQGDQRLIYLGKSTKIEVPVPHVLTAFDVRPHLLRRWGLFKEADLVGCEFYSPAQEDAANRQERAG